MKWDSPILRLGAAVGAVGGIVGFGVMYWPSPINADYQAQIVEHQVEFRMADNRSLDNKIRWLLQDKFNAMRAAREAKRPADKLFWQAKVQAIDIQIKQAMKQVRK